MLIKQFSMKFYFQKTGANKNKQTLRVFFGGKTSGNSLLPVICFTFKSQNGSPHSTLRTAIFQQMEGFSGKAFTKTKL